MKKERSGGCVVRVALEIARAPRVVVASTVAPSAKPLAFEISVNTWC
jgi:hypothetical protein